MSTAKETEPFQSLEVAAIFAEYPVPIREKLLALRQLIFDLAKSTDGVGSLEEALKWGQPSYLTPQTRSGTTIRIDRVKKKPGHFALYVHCQTTLIDDFRQKYGDEFTYETTRAIHFSATDRIPKQKVSEFIRSALTYHLGDRVA